MGEHDWIANIQVGYVLRERSGAFRIVRKVTRSPRNPQRISVTFVIRHCSWTHRCYTVLCTSDLKTRGFRPTGVHITKLKGPLDAKIQENIDDHNCRSLNCCAVAGIS